MIEIRTRVHDRYSLEFKIGFTISCCEPISNFEMNTWMFVPNSLAINRDTYTKNQFYRDLKTNVRLITPVFALGSIVDGDAMPLHNLSNSLKRLAADPSAENVADYEYQIKMFAAIFKSAARDYVLEDILQSDPLMQADRCKDYIYNVKRIVEKYNELRQLIHPPIVSQTIYDYYLFGDESLATLVEQNTFKLLNYLKQQNHPTYEIVNKELLALITQTIEHKKKQGYLTVDIHSQTNNQEIIFRRSILKKYIESDLFLNTNKKRDGVLVEQIYLSLAAGISMIFATAIAFSFQQKYGSFTMPLFVALVVSYMLKDRIKELTRYYFAHKRSPKYFDNKITISIKDKIVGWSKEAFDFVSEAHVPPEVMEVRERTPLVQADNRITTEKIILYRKHVQINNQPLNSSTPYYVNGINEIVRFNVSQFMQRMDYPHVPLYVLDPESGYTTVTGDKIYYTNFVMQFRIDQRQYFKRYRMVYNREGIKNVEELR